MVTQIKQKQLSSKETYWYLKSTLLLIALLLTGLVKAYPDKIQNPVFTQSGDISERFMNKAVSDNNTSQKKQPVSTEKQNEWTDKKHNGKSGKHINVDARHAAEKKWKQAKTRLTELKQQKRTKEVAKQIKKTENQIKHWYRKMKATGETHWRRGK